MSASSNQHAAKKRVAVLLSGRGSNMVALADATAAPDHPAKIVAMLSDRRDAGGLAIARERGIEAIAVDRRDFSGKAAHEAAMLAALDRVTPDIICLAGYMRLLSPDFVARHHGRILNIHPSLLPLFPGLDTHRRALDAGVRLHGCTVHFVDENMDEGAIIAQGAVPVLQEDTPETLSARVLAVEHKLYPLALALVASGRARLVGDRVRLDGFDMSFSDGTASLLSPSASGQRYSKGSTPSL